MKRAFLANVWWYTISGFLLFGACRSGEHQQKDNTSVQVKEMPKPGTEASMDSLKRIQQMRRDSLMNRKN